MHQEVILRCKHAKIAEYDSGPLKASIPKELKIITHCNQSYFCEKSSCKQQKCMPEPYELNN